MKFETKTFVGLCFDEKGSVAGFLQGHFKFFLLA